MQIFFGQFDDFASSFIFYSCTSLLDDGSCTQYCHCSMTILLHLLYGLFIYTSLWMSYHSIRCDSIDNSITKHTVNVGLVIHLSLFRLYVKKFETRKQDIGVCECIIKDESWIFTNGNFRLNCVLLAFAFDSTQMNMKTNAEYN